MKFPTVLKMALFRKSEASHRSTMMWHTVWFTVREQDNPGSLKAPDLLIPKIHGFNIEETGTSSTCLL